MGLSLELPTMHLNESDMFSPPMIRSKSKGADSNQEEPTPFLWQAPNSNAALYFGEKWVEFHSFLTSRVSVDPATVPPRPNLISESYPSWLEHILELMRARGYTLLYPNYSSDRESIATLHYELFHPPEEFTKPQPQTETPHTPLLDPETETFPTDLSSSHRPKHAESTPVKTKLTSLLPNRGFAVPELSDFPLLSHEGNELSSSLLSATARSFTTDFRRQVGICAATYKPKPEAMKADDLFCNNDPEGRVGRSSADISSDQPFATSMPPDYKPKPPGVMDDDAIRQSEFEAHLNRQAGRKEDLAGKKKEGEKGGTGGVEKEKSSEGSEKEEVNEKSDKETKKVGMAEFNDFLKKAEKERSEIEGIDKKSDKETKKVGMAEFNDFLKKAEKETGAKTKDTKVEPDEKEVKDEDKEDEKSSVKDRGW